MCLHTKELPEPIVMFNIESAGQVYNQTNEVVYLGENVNHNVHEADLFGGICGAHEGYKAVEVRDVRRTGEGVTFHDLFDSCRERQGPTMA